MFDVAFVSNFPGFVTCPACRTRQTLIEASTAEGMRCIGCAAALDVQPPSIMTLIGVRLLAALRQAKPAPKGAAWAKTVVYLVFFAILTVTLAGVAARWYSTSTLRAAIAVLRGEMVSPDVLAARRSLDLEKLTNEAYDVRFYAAVKRVATVAGLTLAAVIGAAVSLILATGNMRQKSVHVAVIGKSSLPVHHRDLSQITPVLQALAVAEQMAAHAESAEQAIKLFSYVGNTAAGLLRSMTGKRGMAAIVGDEQAAALPAAAASVPTFRDLLQDGEFAPSKPLLFGFDALGERVTGLIDEFYSVGFAGFSGSGKTATLRNLIAQCLLTRVVGRVYVVDAHYPHPKSLLTSLGSLRKLPQVRYVEHAADTADLLAEIHHLIDRRLAGLESSTPIILVAMDEFLRLAATLPAAAALVERIGTESRKAGVYGFFAAQSWNGDKVGGTTVRDNLVALAVHAMKRKQADTLLQDADDARTVTKLQVGQMLLRPAMGEAQVVTVPYCSPDDMGLVHAVLTDGADVTPVVDEPLQDSTLSSVESTLSDDATPLNTPCNAALETAAPSVLAEKIRRFVDAKKKVNAEYSMSKFAAEVDVNKGTLSAFLTAAATDKPKSLTDEQTARVVAVVDGITGDNGSRKVVNLAAYRKA